MVSFRFCRMFSDPSVVGMRPSSRAAMMIHWRCRRLPATYILIVLVSKYFEYLDVPRLVLRVDHVLPKDSGAGRVHARPDQLARADPVGVAEHVGGAGLRVARGGDAVGQVRQVGPDVGAMQIARGAHVGVRVDEAGHNGLARDIDDAGVGGDVQGAGGAYRGDAIVVHHDIGQFDHPRVCDRHHARPAQQQGPARRIPLDLNVDPDLDGGVAVVVPIGLPGLFIPLLTFLSSLASRASSKASAASRS